MAELVVVVAEDQEILTAVLRPRPAVAFDLFYMVNLRDLIAARRRPFLAHLPALLAGVVFLLQKDLADGVPRPVREAPLDATGTRGAAAVVGAPILELCTALPAVPRPWVTLLAVVAVGLPPDCRSHLRTAWLAPSLFPGKRLVCPRPGRFRPWLRAILYLIEDSAVPR